MKFNPISRRLYTDDLKLLKTLDCPATPRLEVAKVEVLGADVACTTCDRVVVDSSRLSDQGIADLLMSDPSTCVMVRLDQPNLTVVHRDPEV